MSTNRVCTELPPPSKAKTLIPALRAEGVTGSPMFALPKGAPNPARNGVGTYAASARRCLLRSLASMGECVQFHLGRLIDHVHLRVSDLEASKRFYRAVLESLDLPAALVEGVGTPAE